MDKNKIIQEISNISGKAVKPLFIITDELEKNINELNSILSEKTGNLITISNEYENISGKIKVEKREIVQARDINRKENLRLDTKKESVEKVYTKLEHENNVLSNRIVNLKEEISRLEKEKSSIEIFEGIKSNLIRDVDIYKKEILDLNKQIEKIGKDKNKTIFDLDKVISDKEQEQEEQLNRVIPSLNKVKERTKELDIKEQDLRVIESRYKKLYTEQGASFKV